MARNPHSLPYTYSVDAAHWLQAVFSMRAALISDLEFNCALLPHILQAIWYCQTCSCIVQLECASSVHPLRFLSEFPPFHTQFFMFLAFSMVIMSELGLELGSGALQLPKRQALLLCIWPPGPVQTALTSAGRLLSNLAPPVAQALTAFSPPFKSALERS